MRSTRLAGLGLAAALLAGGAAIAPAVTAPADAAVVAPVVVAASKPKFKTNLPSRKIVKVNKYTTLKVKATGGSVKYQWYYASYTDWLYKKVSGKAGKRSYLKVKATLAKSGGQYMVVIRNSKGTKKSRPTTILVKNTAAKPFGLYKRGVTAHWSFSPTSWSSNLYNGKTVLRAYITPRNETSKKRNPKGQITIAFRDKNGKLWADKNANGKYLASDTDWTNRGINNVGSAKKGYTTKYSAMAKVVVPTSLATGGRWVITDKSSPSMKLYFKQG